MARAATHSTSSCASARSGAVEPRIFPAPLRDLTPATSFGFDVIDFARDVLGTPLDPWQEWLCIHAGELLPNDLPRFRIVLVIVGRQSGKTFLTRVLTLYWLYIERHAMILSTSSLLDYARDSWEEVVRVAEDNEWLAPHLGRITRRNGSHEVRTKLGSAYRIAAANDKGGRSLSLDRVIMDELRMHKTYDSWGAVKPAMNARPASQLWAITNQGDDESVVLNALREAALTFVETGRGDERTGLFEYSAPEGSDPLDPAAICAANPNAGHRQDLDALLGDAQTAVNSGDPLLLAQFKTEVMCMRVPILDGAIDPSAWDRCGVDAAKAWNPNSDPRTAAWFLDVSYDESHATIVAATVGSASKLAHVRTVRTWSGPNVVGQVRQDLPGMLADHTPRRFGWFPASAAAPIGTMLLAPTYRPPRGTTLDPVTTDLAVVCMGLPDVVTAGEIQHPRDPLIDLHVKSAGKQRTGARWTFKRGPKTPVDAAYALAGAVHLARTMAGARPPLRVST
jgi:hypothetical protein